MFSASAQFRFAAELVAMLVAAAGFLLVAGRLRVGRWVLAAAGLGALAAVAFVRGAELGGGDALAGLRLAGAGAVGVAGVSWAGGVPRRAVVSGAALTAAAAAFALAGGPDVVAAALLIAGSVLMAVALVATAQRSIVTRMAVNAAATLLVVVLVLSVALSAVLSSSVEHQELAASQSQAAMQATEVAASADRGLAGARLIAADLQGWFSAPGRPDLAAVTAGAVAGRRADRRAVAARLRTVAAFYPQGAVGFVRGGTVLGHLPVGARGGVDGRLSCRRGTAGSSGRSAVVAVGTRAEAVGAFPLCASGPLRMVGTVVAAVPIDRSYLAGLLAGAGSGRPGLAVVGGGRVLASAGPPPPAPATLRPPARTGEVRAWRDRGRLLAMAAVEVPGAGDPTVSVVSSASAGALSAAGASLALTLALVSLGGTLLALVVAAAAGDRISWGLRRLTAAAADVRAGGSSVRAGVGGGDEVGVLAAAFDAMVGSVEQHAGALRAAAGEEARLRNRLEAIVAGMGDALVAVDSLGRITDFNRAAEELTGVAAAVAVGGPLASSLTLLGSAGAELSRHLDRLDPAPWSGLTDLRRADGVTVPVAVSAGAVRGPVGQEIGTVLVLRDLRPEQEVERMKSEFLSRAGHELRTPLTGIIGYAELLARPEVPPAAAAGWRAEILQAARRQLRIVRLLELFASAAAGRLDLRSEEVDVGAVVGKVVAAVADHPVALAVAPGLPPVLADREWLAVAVEEVLDNAVRYSPADRPVEVRVGPAPGGDGDPEEVAVTVVDAGPGMTDEELAAALGPWTQGDTTDTRRYGGLGLGLPAAAQILAAHGGRLTCHSGKGEGTSVTLCLASCAKRP